MKPQFNHFGILCIFLSFTALFATNAEADEKTWSFGVLNQRSISLTAEYWNPILRYVSRKSGVPLRLDMGKTAPETDAMIGDGAFGFVYSNTIFTPANEPAGYRVFARPQGPAIQGQIVTLENSPIHSLRDLEQREVGFPSLLVCIDYVLPMSALFKAGIAVKPVFAGNQEGVLGQLKSGRVIAASVNSRVMNNFAQRENTPYRILWSSAHYLDFPLSAHPRVPQKIVAAVRAGFLGMAHDPEGMKILQAGAALIKQAPPLGFAPASDREYRNYREFFRGNQPEEP